MDRLSFRRYLVGGLSAALIVLTLLGCATTNPVGAATDLSQRVYALYGTFVITEEQAAQLATDPATPVPVKIALRAADAKAKPTADALVHALHDYQTASDTLHTATGSSQQLALATVNLNTWIAQAQNDVTALVSAVKSRADP